jgi:hypothetical protein
MNRLTYIAPHTAGVVCAMVAQKTGGIAYRTQPEKDQEQAQHV